MQVLIIGIPNMSINLNKLLHGIPSGCPVCGEFALLTYYFCLQLVVIHNIIKCPKLSHAATAILKLNKNK